MPLSRAHRPFENAAACPRPRTVVTVHDHRGVIPDPVTKRTVGRDAGIGDTRVTLGPDGRVLSEAFETVEGHGRHAHTITVRRDVLADVLGSAVGVAQDGIVNADLTWFGDFGDTLSPPEWDTVTSFTGHVETAGLTEFATRTYDPASRVWVQEDSFTGTVTRASSLNRYAYVEGSPVSHTDVLGAFRAAAAMAAQKLSAVEYATFIQWFALLSVIGRYNETQEELAAIDAQAASEAAPAVMAYNDWGQYSQPSRPLPVPDADYCANMQVGFEYASVNEVCGKAMAREWVYSTGEQWRIDMYEANQSVDRWLQPAVPLRAIGIGSVGAPRPTVATNRAPRLPQDVAVNPAAPRALSLERPVGGSASENAFVQEIVVQLRASGASDFRVNQQQIDVDGTRVGVNRPDLQYTLKGQRYYEEFDVPSSTCGPVHETRILSNDPNGLVELFKKP